MNLGVRIVKMVNRLPRTTAAFALGNQIIRSGTGIGANIEEADAGESKEDFVHKVKISLKEAQETRYWLRTIVESEMLTDAEKKHCTKKAMNSCELSTRSSKTLWENEPIDQFPMSQSDR